MPKCKDCHKKQSAPHRLICHSCVIKRFKQNNPVKYAYFVLRQNAKRRGKKFTITFDYFKNFVHESSYMDFKGRNKTDFTIDRKENNLGYVAGNLQIKTMSENCSKGQKHEGIYTDAIVNF